MKGWLESVPNISEGRDQSKLLTIIEPLQTTPGVHLLDFSRDVDHHRAVATVIGRAEPLFAALHGLAKRAVELIDLRQHQGGHPRIGALDVLPLIPLDPADEPVCLELAHKLGAALARDFQLPVALYESAARTAARRNLADLRRGGFEGLAARLKQAAWQPDFGPPAPHPTAGMTAIGVRRPLVAFNVNLATQDLSAAAEIARTVRASNGGVPGLKAIAVDLPAQGCVQVSMNLVDLEKTGVWRAFSAVRTEAERLGVAILDCELIGLAPRLAMRDVLPDSCPGRAVTPDQLLETRVLRLLEETDA